MGMSGLTVHGPNPIHQAHSSNMCWYGVASWQFYVIGNSPFRESSMTLRAPSLTQCIHWMLSVSYANKAKRSYMGYHPTITPSRFQFSFQFTSESYLVAKMPFKGQPRSEPVRFNSCKCYALHLSGLRPCVYSRTCSPGAFHTMNNCISHPRNQLFIELQTPEKLLTPREICQSALARIPLQ
jgi:hypothetical protein